MGHLSPALLIGPCAQHTLRVGLRPHTNSSSLVPRMLQAATHPRISLSPKGEGRESHSGPWGSPVRCHPHPQTLPALAWGGEELSAVPAPRSCWVAGLAQIIHSFPAGGQTGDVVWSLEPCAFLWGFCSGPHTWSFILFLIETCLIESAL